MFGTLFYTTLSSKACNIFSYLNVEHTKKHNGISWIFQLHIQVLYKSDLETGLLASELAGNIG